MPYLAAATVFTYGFRADGRLIPPAENRIPQTAEEYGSSAIIELATLTEDDRFDSSLSTALFASEEAQTKLISALAAELSSKGYQGVELDLEYIPSSERESYVRFTERLAETLRPLGYTGFRSRSHRKPTMSSRGFCMRDTTTRVSDGRRTGCCS